MGRSKAPTLKAQYRSRETYLYSPTAIYDFTSRYPGLELTPPRKNSTKGMGTQTKPISNNVTGSGYNLIALLYFWRIIYKVGAWGLSAVANSAHAIAMRDKKRSEFRVCDAPCRLHVYRSSCLGVACEMRRTQRNSRRASNSPPGASTTQAKAIEQNRNNIRAITTNTRRRAVESNSAKTRGAISPRIEFYVWPDIGYARRGGGEGGPFLAARPLASPFRRKKHMRPIKKRTIRRRRRSGVIVKPQRRRTIPNPHQTSCKLAGNIEIRHLKSQ